MIFWIIGGVLALALVVWAFWKGVTRTPELKIEDARRKAARVQMRRDGQANRLSSGDSGSINR